MKNKTRAIIAAVCVAAVVGGASSALVYREMQADERCEATEAYLVERGAPPTISEGEESVYVIGDSYTSGDVLDARTDAWVHDYAEVSGTEVTVDGIGGTGFVNPGNCDNASFERRVRSAVSATPDTLIIQGGLNDWKAETAEIEAAAYNMLATTSEVEQVVVIGPPSAPARAEEAAEVDATLRAIVEAQGGEYISTLDWELPFGPDGLHLTPEGHELFADYLAAESAA